MKKSVIRYLLLSLLAGLPFSISATPASAPAAMESVPLSGQSEVEPARVDLNTADVATLQKALNGIGKAKAEAIVAYREANGRFASVDELLEIKGIGSVLLERNRDRLTVD